MDEAQYTKTAVHTHLFNSPIREAARSMSAPVYTRPLTSSPTAYNQAPCLDET